ncbi:MAG TPA: trigger factor [Acidimicrobiales bacterium]|nr:trigger factor [Acidimicrobiales bacterium]
MRATAQPLEDNKVRLSVEVDEAEFERALNDAFRKMAREVRVPGFRPGKVPRRLLEARLGTEVLRQEAFRESLPDFYAQALEDADVDAIAAPEIEITAGQEAGPVAFDAVVPVRPVVTIPGYQGLQVTLAPLAVTDEEVDRQVDRLRDQFGELTTVSRPARDGDHLTIDIKGYRHDETIEPLTTDDFLYEVGSGSIVPELDEQLRGAKSGDIFRFNATVDEQDVSFQVLVKEVKEKILPEVTDEWASDASEFDTVQELRDETRKRLAELKRMQAQMALRDQAARALSELVDEDMPDVLIEQELERRLHDLSHRLESQGATLGQYLEAAGTDQDQLLGELRQAAEQTVRADLALRALADAESIEVDDADVEKEIATLAERLEQRPEQLLRQLERAERMPELRSDIRKGKAFNWLVDHVELVDEEGKSVDRALLFPPSPESPPDEASEAVGRDSGPGGAGEPSTVETSG